MIGTKIGPWLITEEIGDGGHAFVFKAVAGSEVAAVKMLKPSVAGEDNLEKRFKIEADALKALSHPCIVGFRDYFYANGYHYLVLEFMDAGSADFLLRNVGPIEPRYIIPIFAKILDGITYAHSFGYIHRDIKPNNILLNRAGDAKITDFGIAKVIGGEELTRKGFVLGTTPYMAPEYLSQGVVTPQTDIYAIGVTLFEMVTNRKPFEQKGDGESVVAFAKRVCFSEPTPPSSYRPIPEDLEKIILRAIARDTKKRYKSADKFLADLKKSFPDLVNRPIEIPAGRPMTRMVSIEDVAGNAASNKGSLTTPARPRLNPMLVLGASLLFGVAIALLCVLVFALPTLATTLSSVAAAGLVLVLAALYERQAQVSTPRAAPPVETVGKKKDPAAPKPPKPEAEEEISEDSMPFHAGGGPQEEFQETDISELSAFLTVTVGASIGKRWGLRPISRIGRDLRFDLRPHDPEISRHHATITFNGVGFLVRDAGSTNGTFVNEVRLEKDEEKSLSPGDLVRVGRTTMRFDHIRGSRR